MIPETDIWAAALLMVKRYKSDAMLEAVARADKLLEEGDMARRRGTGSWPEQVMWPAG